jgi:hypothetical protein
MYLQKFGSSNDGSIPKSTIVSDFLERLMISTKTHSKLPDSPMLTIMSDTLDCLGNKTLLPGDPRALMALEFARVGQETSAIGCSAIFLLWEIPNCPYQYLRGIDA